MVHGKSVFCVHRVFYDSAMKKKATLIENLPTSIQGLGALSMLQDIEQITDAFERPTIYIPEWNSGA